MSIGTGFLCKVAVSAEKACLLLVSNRHVYGDPANPIQLAFHHRNPNGSPELGHVVLLNQNDFTVGFTGHPDSEVDLACVNVSQIAESEPPVYLKSVDETLATGFEESDLLPGSDVWFVGYPEGRFDTRHNLPLLRRGYIASIPSVDFEGRKQFVIDAQVFPGSSGSPVFAALGNSYRLIGVVTQTMIRNEKLQAVPTIVSVGVQQTIGLGIVLKSSLLKPLFDAATRIPRERARVGISISTQTVNKTA